MSGVDAELGLRLALKDRVKAAAGIKDTKRQIGEIGSVAQKSTDMAKKGFLGLKMSMGKVLAMAGGVVAAIGMKKVLSTTTSAFTDLAVGVIGFRRVAGGSVKEASRLRTAIQLSGVDSAKATTSLTIFAKTLGRAATDEKKTAAMTKLLGQSFTNADGSVKNMHQILPGLADKFAAMPDGIAKTTLATQLFGKSGTAMIPFLNKGAAGLAALRKKSDELGLSMTQKGIDKFGEYRGAQREFAATIQGLKVTIGGALLPVLTKWSQIMTANVTPAVSGLMGWLKSTGAFDAFGRIVERVALFVGDLGNRARELLTPLVLVAATLITDMAPGIAATVEKGVQLATQLGSSLMPTLRDLGERALPVVRGVIADVGDAAQTIGPPIADFVLMLADLAERYGPKVAQIVGGVLLAALAGVGSLVKDQVAPAVAGLIQYLADHEGIIIGVAAAIGAYAVVLGTAKVVMLAVTVATRAWAIVTGVVTGIVRAATAVQAAYNFVLGLSRSYLATWIGVKALEAAAWARSAAATVASTTATVASTVATKAAAVASKAWATAQWLLNAAMSANPLGLIVVGIGLLIGAAALAYKKVGWFRAGVDAAFAGIKTAIGWVIDAAGAVVSWVKSHWQLLLGLLTGPIGAAVLLVVKHWDRIKEIFSTGVSAVVGFAKSLPGRIGSALAGLFRVVTTPYRLAFQGALALARNFGPQIVAFIASIPGKIIALGGKFLNAGKSLVGKLFDGLAKLGSIGVQLGKDIWSGIKTALNAGIQAVNDAIPNKIGIGPASINLPDNPIPRLAQGGPVQAGSPYIVGDRGPRHAWELFVPETDGYVHPRVPTVATPEAPRPWTGDDIDTMLGTDSDLTVGPAWPGGPIVLQLVVDGRVLAETVVDDLSSQAARQ